MKKLLTLFLVLTCVGVWAQQAKPLPKATKTTPIDAANLPKLVKPNVVSVPPATPFWQAQPSVAYRSLGAMQAPVLGVLPRVTLSEGDLPLVIEGGDVSGLGGTVRERAVGYLGVIGGLLPLVDAATELAFVSEQTDDLGITHVRLQQYLEGVKVYGAEARMQARAGVFYRYNGRIYPTPTLVSVQPSLSEAVVSAAVEADLRTFTTFNTILGEQLDYIGGAQFEFELVVYHAEHKADAEVLAWQVEVYPNIGERWLYFVDATTGAVVHKFRNVCKLHGALDACTGHNIGAATMPQAAAIEQSSPLFDGPATATATDLSGSSVTINTYLFNSKYYLIDASRPMFNAAQSSFPNSPVGVIMTATGNNTSPQGSFNATHITTTNNSWSNPKAVSAHNNAGKAYLYYKNTFNRNSINGQGGKILSFINVSESNGSSMDNAFWNGEAMFYGNGNQYFTPLPEALDVAGHEMSHGVIEKTANLEYQGESGALNESFADIFGAMIDRDDWRMGEDIVLTSVFPSGALRSLQDPHNGGSSLNDPGWQPRTVSEKYSGSSDNGGVHINSGITNYAFYLFASDGSVGKDKAEQVFYRALDQYLVLSSKFIDLRSAVLQAITDLNYGSAVTNAATNAFNTVGIGSGGSTSGAVYQQNLPVNPGADFILYADLAHSNLFIQTPDGTPVADPLSQTNFISRPSVSDAGNEIVFIAADKTMHYIYIDWASGNVTEDVISADPIWRNVVISKDGWKIAALTDDQSNTIDIYSFVQQSWQTYSLYNPTSAQGGNATNEVKYADGLEFDHAGEWVVYDAFNQFDIDGGLQNYWDIGFMHVWDNGSDNFADGGIEKLFSSLPPNAGVGNPTFSKNSPYIIAFDYFDNSNNAVIGINLETGAQGTIYENNTLGFPNFSRLDDKAIFDTENNGALIVAQRSLATSKISGTGSATILVDPAQWGVWFANGVRDLQISTTDVDPANGLSVSPNPATTSCALALGADRAEVAQINLFDMTGQRISTTTWSLTTGKNTHTLALNNLPAGMYMVQVVRAASIQTQRIMVGE